MGREVGGRFKREGTCVYLWVIYVAVWQKPMQYCKAVIFQVKIKSIKKIKEKRSNLVTGYHFPPVKVVII